MTIGKKIGWGFGIILGILVLIGSLSFWSTLQFLDTSWWVTHTHEVLEDLESLLSLLKDVETGQRGFLLTRKEVFLKPYDDALKEIDKTKIHLRESINDNPKQKD